MKYEIETLIAIVGYDEKQRIEQILNGEPYEVIDMSEGGEVIDDEKTARQEFEKLRATAHQRDDGKIEVRIPVLTCGKEELEEDVMEGDEPFYYLAESEEIDRQDFDEESARLFHKIGFEWNF